MPLVKMNSKFNKKDTSIEILFIVKVNTISKSLDLWVTDILKHHLPFSSMVLANYTQKELLIICNEKRHHFINSFLASQWKFVDNIRRQLIKKKQYHIFKIFNLILATPIYLFWTHSLIYIFWTHILIYLFWTHPLIYLVS